MKFYGVIETYEEYVKVLESEGWFREEININKNSYFVTIKSIKKGFTDRLIIVKCPGFYNTHQMILHNNTSLYLNIKDEHNIELDAHTKMFICHIRPSEFVNQLSRTFYSELKKSKYEDVVSKQVFSSLRGEDLLVFSILNSSVNIQKENTKFSIDTADFWIKNN